MDADVFVPFVFFGFLAAVILVPIWLRERTKQSAHKLISQALDKGQPLDPQIMRDLTQGVGKQQQQQSAPRRTLGSGIVLLALAAAFGAIALINQDAHSWTVVPALIVGAVGAAFLLLAIVDYTTKKKDM
ncbi:MAG: DUF6249 domain-containing protein [Terricaulis sp.]